MGLNGLYLNKKGRERDGILEPGDAKDKLMEIKERLEQEVDRVTGQRVIRNAYLAEEIYKGAATEYAPDLIIGYNRGYRASWGTCLGDLTDPDPYDDGGPGDAEPVPYLSRNRLAWSADHCADALEVPGVLICNRKYGATEPALIDVAPSILAEFGLETPSSMAGKSIFT
jgi:predicted AlkP superfamily phosphohydrolase/phosphomutase